MGRMWHSAAVNGFEWGAGARETGCGNGVDLSSKLGCVGGVGHGMWLVRAVGVLRQ